MLNLSEISGSLFCLCLFQVVVGGLLVFQLLQAGFRFLAELVSDSKLFLVRSDLR